MALTRKAAPFEKATILERKSNNFALTKNDMRKMGTLNVVTVRLIRSAHC